MIRMGVLHNKRTLVFEHSDVFKKLSMKAQIYILNLSPDHEFLDYRNVVLNSKRWLQDHEMNTCSIPIIC